jgi:hypothetical protein
VLLPSEGQEQSFNSLDAQRESCEAFIRSQRHEGWQAMPTCYDDGGYSGGSLFFCSSLPIQKEKFTMKQRLAALPTLSKAALCDLWKQFFHSSPPSQLAEIG